MTSVPFLEQIAVQWVLKADDTKSLQESAVTSRWIVTRSEREQCHHSRSNLL